MYSTEEKFPEISHIRKIKENVVKSALQQPVQKVIIIMGRSKIFPAIDVSLESKKVDFQRIKNGQN